MEKRREDKTNTVQIRRTNAQRNVEKIRQIPYKRTNVQRNVEKITKDKYCTNELTYGETLRR